MNSAAVLDLLAQHKQNHVVCSDLHVSWDILTDLRLHGGPSSLEL